MNVALGMFPSREECLALFANLRVCLEDGKSVFRLPAADRNTSQDLKNLKESPV